MTVTIKRSDTFKVLATFKANNANVNKNGALIFTDFGIMTVSNGHFNNADIGEKGITVYVDI